MGAKWVRVTRNVVGIGSLLLAIGMAMSANFGIFVQRELYNNAAFVRHTDDLIANPSVRESIATAITDEIVAQVPQLQSFEGIVTTAVSTVVGTKQFRDVFDRALGSAHEQIVSGSDQITLDLGAAANPIIQQLTGGIPFVSSFIPDLTGVLEVTVLTREQAPDLWNWVERTDMVSSWAWLVALALLVIGVVLVTKHWLGVAGAGAAVSVAAVSCFLTAWGLQVSIRSQFAPGLQQQTYQAVFDEFSGVYMNQTFLMLLLGGIVLVAGVVGELVSLNVKHRKLAAANGTAGSESPSASGTGRAQDTPVPSGPATTPRAGPPLLDS